MTDPPIPMLSYRAPAVEPERGPLRASEILKGTFAAFTGSACLVFDLWFARMTFEQLDQVSSPVIHVACVLLAMVPAVLSFATAKSYFKRENRDE